MYNSRTISDEDMELPAICVSKDGVIGGVALQNNEILIYRFMDRKGQLLPEKEAKKPIVTHRVQFKHLTKIIELFIFRKPATHKEPISDDYQMYVVFEDGIVLFNGVNRRNDQILVLDSSTEGPIMLFQGCCHVDPRQGILLVDVMKRQSNGQTDHFIKRFQGSHLQHMQALDSQKEYVRFFKDHVVEVKPVTKGGAASHLNAPS